MDLYRTLNVHPDSTLDEIKKQYKILALKHHPDRNDGDVNIFKQINSAYTILSDENKRMEYDNESRKFIDINTMNDIFESIFNSEQQQKITIDLNFNEILYGCYKQYNIVKTLDCDMCRKTGIHNPHKNTIMCKDCSGSGFHPLMQFLSCTTCDGRGIHIINHVLCSFCNGKGEHETKEERSIYLQPGIRNNEIIEISKAIILIVKHRYDNTVMSIKDKNIKLCLDIELQELLCGFQKNVTIGHEIMTFQSKGIFDCFRDITIPGKGVGSSGNLVVNFKLYIDKGKQQFYKKLGKSINLIFHQELSFGDSQNTIHIEDY